MQKRFMYFALLTTLMDAQSIQHVLQIVDQENRLPNIFIPRSQTPSRKALIERQQLGTLPMADSFVVAVRKNNQKLVKRLVRQYPDLINQRGSMADAHVYPLIEAVTHGYVDLVEFLLHPARGGRPFANTPGARVNVQDEMGRSPLIWSFMSKKDYNLSEDIIYRIVELLLRHGAHVNQRSHDGKTALHYAAYRGYPRVVELLLEHGAHQNLKDNKKLRPIQFAYMKGQKADQAEAKKYTEVVSILKQHRLPLAGIDKENVAPQH